MRFGFEFIQGSDSVSLGSQNRYVPEPESLRIVYPWVRFQDPRAATPDLMSLFLSLSMAGHGRPPPALNPLIRQFWASRGQL